MVFERKSISFRTKQTVVKELSTKPYVGFENTSDLPDGWLYDIRRWASPFDLKVPSLPRRSEPSYQGLAVEDYFQSGVGDKDSKDLKVIKIEEQQINSTKKWLPIINNGTYYKYDTSYFYYGDNSVVEYINPTDNRSSRNYIELSKTPETISPILAASFKRDPDTKEVDYRKHINQVYKFSGLYSSGEELITVTEAGKINWSNINTTKREFIVDNTINGITRLFFNRDFTEQIGVVPTSYSDLKACEHIGTASASSHQIQYADGTYIYSNIFYLENFPVLLDGFHLYVVNSSAKTYEEWYRVDSWWDLLFHPNTGTSLPSSGSTNRYFVDKDLGIVYFASDDPSELPAASREILVAYNVTLRIEYEEQDTEQIITAEKANVNPISQTINQGFVCITHQNMDPYSITLEINKPRIRNTSDPILHGPITIGSDYSILTATVTGVNGNVLSNIPVTFTVDPDNVGFLNGSKNIGYGITNEDGEAYAIYQPPTSAEDLGHYSTIARNSTSASYPGQREVVISSTEDLGWDGNEDDVYIFQVLKDDIILGYKTLDDYLLSIYQEETPHWVTDSATYTQWKAEMEAKYEMTDFQSEPISSGTKINGRKVIIYQIGGSDNVDATAINPVTGLSSAVVPVKPLAVEEDSAGLQRIIYSAGAIVDCGASEDVAGYWLISSKIIKFRAYCWSNYFNNYIYSNYIYAKLGLPSYMIGEYINSNNKIIPFGWKFRTDTDLIASGLDGATFFTINPYKGPYPVLDLVGGTGETGDWASAPFRTVGFQFSIS